MSNEASTGVFFLAVRTPRKFPFMEQFSYLPFMGEISAKLVSLAFPLLLAFIRFWTTSVSMSSIIMMDYNVFVLRE